MDIPIAALIKLQKKGMKAHRLFGEFFDADEMLVDQGVAFRAARARGGRRVGLAHESVGR